MRATESATVNQQGQLTSDQRATISSWLAGYQMRAVPALLPLLVVIGLGMLMLPRLGAGVSVPDGARVVVIVVAAILAVTGLYALSAARRILALSGTRAGLRAPRIQAVIGTVVRHGDEQVAVLTDGRTWSLGLHPNVCREIRQLAVGTYLFYVLPLTIPRDGAWLLAAQTLDSSSADETQTLLQTLAATNRFVLDGLADNRAGHLCAAQVKALAGTFRSSTWRNVWLGVAAIIIGALVGTDENDRWVGLGLAIVGLLVILYNLGPGRARQAADLSQAEVMTYAGPIRAVRNMLQDDVQQFFYEAGAERFRVGQAAFEALDERYRYRLYYLPRTRTLVNIEPIALDPSEMAAVRRAARRAD